MGKAIIINDVNFASAGIGVVTPSESVDLISITLSEGTRVGNNINIDVEFNPNNATYRGLEWSILSGSEYATINNGVLTILEGADDDSVTIKAISSHDSTIYDTLTLDVTYDDSAQEYDGLVFDGASGVDTGISIDSTHKIEMKVTLNFSAQSGDSNTANRILLGGRKSSSENRRDFQYQFSKVYGTLNQFIFGTGNNSTNISNSSSIVDGDTVVLRSEPGTVSVDSVTKSASIGSFTYNKNYYVGCQNDDNGVSDTNLIFDTIHYLKIWDSQDNLIAHLVPAFYEGEAGLWDKVSEEFHGNAKSGILVLI